MWTSALPEALKCPNEGVWVVGLRVTENGEVSHESYTRIEDLELIEAALKSAWRLVELLDQEEQLSDDRTISELGTLRTKLVMLGGTADGVGLLNPDARPHQEGPSD